MGRDDAPAGPMINLEGLSIASPIGFMAALGLLRVCALDHGRDVRLRWAKGHAQLVGIEREDLIELLTVHMRGRSSAPEFNFEVTAEKGGHEPVSHLRTLLPEDFRAAVRACSGDRRALSFLAGFGTDSVITDKGFIARTKFDFTSGQQRLVAEFRDLAGTLDPDAKRQRHPLRTRVERALFGGAYEERSSLGWDPATLMSHAHQPIAPTDSATPGQPMLIWLAVEALPLHPVVPDGPRRARTTGFLGAKAYAWPEWAEPLSLPEVSLVRMRPVETLGILRGVVAIWLSTVTSVGKYGYLLPGSRTESVGASPTGFSRPSIAAESTV